MLILTLLPPDWRRLDPLWTKRETRETKPETRAKGNTCRGYCMPVVEGDLDSVNGGRGEAMGFPP